MFCPRCRSEYGEGHTHCQECDVDLVGTLPPPPPPDLVAALETTDGLLVSATRSALESAGIPVVVQGEEAQGLFPVSAVLLVPPDRLDEARAIIEQPDAASSEES